MTGLLAAIVTLGLVGCGGGGSHHHSATSRTSTASARRPATSTGGATTTPTRRPIVTVPSDVPQPSTAGQTTDRYSIAIYDLRRTGSYVTLDFGFRCLSDGCFSQSDFAVNTPNPEYNAAAGVTLLDPVADKQYFPVTDGSGNADVSAVSPQTDDHDMHLAYATFRAPPASVSHLDVLFPQGGTQVAGIPVSSTAQAPDAAQLGRGTVQASAAPFNPNGSLTRRVDTLRLLSGNPDENASQSATRTTITLRSDVLFRFDKSSLTSRARSLLRSAAQQIRAHARGRIVVTGYTDSKGTDAVNLPLSKARAGAVVSYLQPATRGSGVTYTATGKGSADPVAPNTLSNGADDPAGRALNRRVTIAYAVRRVVKRTVSPPPPPPSEGSATTGRTLVYHGGLSVDPSTYRIGVQSVARDGNLAVLRLQITCTHGNNTGCANQFDLAGTTSVPPASLASHGGTLDQIYDDANTIGGFYLEDQAGTIFSVARDAGGLPVCTAVESLDAGATLSGWLYFPAPPASVKSVSVVLPGGGQRVRDVPISG